MGLKDNEAVTPVFPNSDYMTGIAGVTGILSALMQKAEKGGSYKVDVALNYYNQWLADSVGEYPEEVWQDVWKRNGSEVYRYVLPKPVDTMRANISKVISQYGLSDPTIHVQHCKELQSSRPEVFRGPGEQGYQRDHSDSGTDRSI